MPDEGQPTGFLNRASVVLFLVFTIPALLTLAGVYYVAVQGRVPGGEDISCEIVLDSDTDLRLDIYRYTAGLVQFETQTVSVGNNIDSWTELFSDSIPLPETLTCDNIFTRLDETNYILQNQKSIAWSTDSGATWAVHRVCDDPRPISGRCDPETLNYIDISLNPDGTGILTVIESEIDTFGEAQRDAENRLIVINQWQLNTTDAGQTWSILSIE